MSIQKLSNRDILDSLNKTVYGHEKAKKVLINQIRRSYLLYEERYLFGNDELESAENYNTLLIGASGTGKTYIVKTLSEILDVPVIYVDGSSLNPSANLTKGVSDIKNGIKKKAQELISNPSRFFTEEGTIAQTIVFIDEFDKLGLSYSKNDDWHKRTQSELLTLVEDIEEFRDVSFIFAGAFTDIRKNRKEEKNSIGFVTKTNEKREKSQITDEDVIEFGLMPELVGRIHNIVELDELSDRDMFKILNRHLIRKEARVFKQLYGIDIRKELSHDERLDMIRKSKDSTQNVRHLKRLLADKLKELEFNSTMKSKARDITTGKHLI